MVLWRDGEIGRCDLFGSVVFVFVGWSQRGNVMFVVVVVAACIYAVFFL